MNAQFDLKLLKGARVVSALIAILLLTACAAPTPEAIEPPAPTEPQATAPSEPAEPATEVPPTNLVVGMGAIAETLNPHMSTSGTAMSAYYALFDALTYIDENAQLQPALATAWQMLDDTTWEFDLRQGVSFHNGEAFDAEAVKFTIEKVLDRDYGARVRGRISLIDEVKVVDSHKVTIHTSKADPLLPKRLSVIFIVPPKYFQEVGEDGFEKNPVGTGSFGFDEFIPGDQITLVALEGHPWRSAPKVDTVTMKFMPEGAVRVAALRTGEIDIAHNLPLDQVASLEAEGFTVDWTSLASTHVVTFRSVIGGPIENTLVRQALNYAVDKETLITNLMLGYASPANGQMIGPDGFGYNPEIKDYPYDPEKARSLLNDAGYADGFDLTMQTTDGKYINDKVTVEAVAGYLEEIGINVNIEVVEASVYTPMIIDGQAAETFFLGWNYFPVQDADFSLGWFHCEDSQQMFCNEEYDELLWASRSEMDPEKRLEYLQEMAQIAHDDPIALFLFRPPDVFGVSPQVAGFAPRFDTVIQFDGISK